MSRMYSGKKGKAGSKKPIIKKTPSWLKYKPAEVELLVVKLQKEELTSSQIGLKLRDMYGIVDVKTLTNKTITQILKEKGLLGKIPEDLTALIKRSIQLRKHLEDNKQDKTAKRGLQLTDSKINRLIKYYKEQKVLEATWKFDRTKAGMYIE